MTQIVVPTLGESVSEATVAKWLKKEGEVVSADEPIVELETDKVTLEVNAPEAGTIRKIIVAEGKNVEVGAILGRLAKALRRTILRLRLPKRLKRKRLRPQRAPKRSRSCLRLF